MVGERGFELHLLVSVRFQLSKSSPNGLCCFMQAHVLATMAIGTQRDQIELGIVTAATTKFLMMDLEIIRAATELASPSIPFQDFATKLLARFRI